MIQRLLPAIILCFFALASQALAHEIRPAFLQIDEVAPQRYELLWKVPTRDGMVQNIRPAFDQGLTLTPVPGETLIGGFVLFRYSLTGEAGLPGTELHIDGLDRTTIDTLVSVSLRNGTHHSFLLRPRDPGVTIPEAPSARAVIQTYTRLGV